MIEGKLSGGVISTMSRLFNLVSTNSIRLLDIVEASSEVQRMETAQKLQDYYSGDIEAIKGHLVNTLGRTFTQEDINEFQMLYLPVVRRIIDKLCIVYKGETERYLDGEGQTDLLRELYDQADADSKAKHWYRLGKLHQTILVQPVVREIHGKPKLQFDIWTPNKITVVEDPKNFLIPDKVIYQVQVTAPTGQHEVRTVFWSKDEHYVLDEKGNVILDPENPQKVNPYGMLPFAVLRFGEPDSFWGTGETLLANIEEKVDVLLIQLIDLLVMQGHGQAVMTNARIEGEIQTGPKHPLMLHPMDPSQPATFAYATVSGKVSEITSAIDWLINKTAVLYGLSQSSSMEQSQTASGYAKQLDNWDVIEKRDEDAAVLAEFERELFRVTKAVAEYEGIAQFPENAADAFYVEFSDYDFPQDPMQEIQTKKLKMDLGLWTPVDDLMEEDPTLTKEEALTILEENLTIKNRLADQFGMTDPLNQNQANGLPRQ